MIDEKLLIETMQWRMREAGTSDWNRCLDEVEKFIKEFSQSCGWIPCSERLPEKNSEVLVTIPAFDVFNDVFVQAEWNGEFFQSDFGDFPTSKEEMERWQSMNHGFSDGYASAWMQLPEPYKAGD